MATLNLNNIGKEFGKTNVLQDVSFDIADGEFVVLVGPSGCGKSTLLRLIAGLDSVSSGKIMIGPDCVNDMPPKKRDIAMVFQSYALYPHMSVEDNMGFALKLNKISRDEIRERVHGAADILGLMPYLDRLPKQLSGGQRQRVAMGRAIVRKPQVFLFDEPLSNLDAKLRVAMRTEIRSLHQRLEATMVYVTHDQVEAMTMGDKIVVMNMGVVEQLGAPLELYDHPVNKFVAGFIGSPTMNFLNGRLTENTFASESGLNLPLGPSHSGNAGRDVIYGVRPEHFVLGGDLTARAMVIEPTGSETMLLADLGGHQVTCLFRDRIDVRPGDDVKLGVMADRVHLFDSSTEARITTDRS